MPTSREILVHEATIAVRMNQNAVDRFDEAVVRYLGINRTDGRCLDILERRGPVTAGELAKEAGLSSGAMTTLLDRLEHLGYVRRVPHPTDRRRVMVELTDETLRLCQEIFGPIKEEASALFAGLSDRQLKAFRDLMQAGCEMLERHISRLQVLPPRTALPRFHP